MNAVSRFRGLGGNERRANAAEAPLSPQLPPHSFVGWTVSTRCPQERRCVKLLSVQGAATCECGISYDIVSFRFFLGGLEHSDRDLVEVELLIALWRERVSSGWRESRFPTRSTDFKLLVEPGRECFEFFSIGIRDCVDALSLRIAVPGLCPIFTCEYGWKK